MSVREYVGARYVPIVVGEWDNSKTYEPLMVVIHKGDSYTSRQYVPAGIDILNEQYWVESANYNAQVDAYRKEVQALDGRVTANTQNIDAEKARAEGAEQNLQTEVQALDGRVTANTQNIDAEKARAEGAEQNLQTKVETYRQEVIEASTHNVFSYANVAAMIADTNLTVGHVVMTQGYYSIGDTGASIYIIASNGTTDKDVIQLSNGLYAILVKDREYYSPYCFGERTGNEVMNWMIGNGYKIDGMGLTYTPTTQLTGDNIYIKNAIFNSINLNGIFARNYLSKNINLNTITVYNALTRNTSNEFSLDAAIALDCINAELSHCTVYNNNGNGIILYNDTNSDDFCTNVSIDSCTAYNNGQVTNNTGIGIGAYASSPDNAALKITNCICYGNKNSGIAPHGINNAIIANNHSYNNSEHGIVVQDSYNNIVANNYANNNNAAGVRVQGNWKDENGHIDNVTITGNTLINHMGINIGWNAHNINITGNYICATSPNYYAIQFETLAARKSINSNINVSGNTIYSYSNRNTNADNYIKALTFNGNNYVNPSLNNDDAWNPQNTERYLSSPKVGFNSNEVLIPVSDFTINDNVTYDGTNLKVVATSPSPVLIYEAPSYGHDISGKHLVAWHLIYSSDDDNPIPIQYVIRGRTASGSLVQDIGFSTTLTTNTTDVNICVIANIDRLITKYPTIEKISLELRAFNLTVGNTYKTTISKFAYSDNCIFLPSNINTI